MIKAYIHKVVSYLPFKQRSDIASELESIIFDACGDDLSEENIKSVLRELGSPRDLALRYSDQNYLIGPEYFARYKELLMLVARIALPIVFVLTFVVQVQERVLGAVHAVSVVTIITKVIIALFSSLATVFTSALSIFAIVTLIFVIIERRESDLELFEFDYESLKQLPSQKLERSYLVEGILTLIGVVIGLFFLLNPESIAVGHIEGTSITLTSAFFHLEVFEKLVPFGLLSLSIAFILALVKLVLRRESKAIYLLEILSSLSWIGFLFYVTRLPNLLNLQVWKETFIRLNIPNVESIFTQQSLRIVIGVFIGITMIGTGISLYKLVKMKRQTQKSLHW